MSATKLSTSAGSVSALIDGPERADALVVLAHGAGAGMESDYMQFFAEGLVGRDMRVLRFNFLYLEQAKKYPDRQPLLEETYRAAIEGARELGHSKLVVGGKSLGGRIASHVVAEGEGVDGLVFLGYPLHPPGRPDRIRDAHLHSIQAPMLFVEGTRDPFCPLDTLEKVRAGLGASTDVFVVEDGDHSLKVRKSSGRSTEEAWSEAIAAVADWIAKL